MPTENEYQVVNRMQAIIARWEAAADQRAIFLRCYSMMTRNMLVAVAYREFHDPDWVDRLLHRFADYYFNALDAFEACPESAPRVWQLAFRHSAEPQVWAIQKLFLGVNAHINFDLVLSLVDLLQPEWSGLSETQRAQRYQDHSKVNLIIARTIDSVQDQVLEPAMPLMDWVDVVFGRADEWMISRLITNWRDTVWSSATQLVEMEDTPARQGLLHEIETDALRRAHAIRELDWLNMM